MDEHIVHVICKYLSPRDVLSFAFVNKVTYKYCTETDRNGKHRDITKNHPYHFNMSLLQNAKLERGLSIMNIVRDLTKHGIPLGHCSYHMQLIPISRIQCALPCIFIIIGRHVVINNVIYTYSFNDAMNDIVYIQKHMKKPNQNTIIRHIQAANTLDMLQRKLQSILSHKYVSVVTTHVDRNHTQDIANVFYGFVNLLTTQNNK